jgi:hypothetical protein
MVILTLLLNDYYDYYSFLSFGCSNKEATTPVRQSPANNASRGPRARGHSVRSSPITIMFGQL